MRVKFFCFSINSDSSDALAEFHLPPSGIEITIDEMPFPHFEKGADLGNVTFLAICSIRRLLNRIHSALYTASHLETPGNFSHTLTLDSPTSPGSTVSSTSDNVCIELARQLDIWYLSLPDSIRPNMDQTVPIDLCEGWLRLRYWSAKHIIHRPYVLLAASSDSSTPLLPHIIQKCEICIDSCRRYLNLATIMLSQRSQYTWMTTQGYVISSSNGDLVENSFAHILQSIGLRFCIHNLFLTPKSSTPRLRHDRYSEQSSRGCEAMELSRVKC